MHILGPSNPFVGAVPSPGLPTYCLFVHPQVPNQLCQAAPARPPFRARQACLSALILDGESCRTKALSEHCRVPIEPAGCRLQCRAPSLHLLSFHFGPEEASEIRHVSETQR